MGVTDMDPSGEGCLVSSHPCMLLQTVFVVAWLCFSLAERRNNNRPDLAFFSTFFSY